MARSVGAQSRRNEVRTLPQSIGEAEEETKVVILCLDERYRTTLAHWLRSGGMGVEMADDGSRAKVLLGAGSRDVLITDRVLPPWPGLPRLADLKRSSPWLCIVAIDKGDPDSRYVAFAAGADAVISPPLRRDEVMRAIRVAEGQGRR
jgi:DNA-binding response OmpR family regulator